MTYSINWPYKVEKQLQKLPEDISSRILDNIDAIKDDPHRFVTRCEGYPHYHRRVGKYRVILEIIENDKRIEVLKVGLRKNVYDR